jgi:arylformamidase
MKQFHDLTLGIAEAMPVWPGDAPLQRTVSRHASGVQVTRFSLGAHAGTHLDAPRHVLGDGYPGVESLALDILVGAAVVVDLSGYTALTADTLAAQLGATAPQRLLLKLRATPLTATNFMAFHSPDESAAHWLVQQGVRLLGLDVPSADAPEAEELAVHRILLTAGIIIVENLLLGDVASGEWQLACLPLKLMGADGAPARAVLWR